MDPDASTLISPARRAGRPLEGGWTLAGRYRVDGVIGRGGMSTVYSATDTVLQRDLAVKVLLPSLAQTDPAHVARFEREARAAAALRHPAVVKIYDTGRDGDTHFIAMERVTGRPLNEVLGDGEPLAPAEATHIAGQVAGALAAAHDAGIVHRDIKPANVMIGSRGEVKILDFGIARARHDPTLTQPAFAIGTAAYMSPERVLGGPGDERSDIYSLGCLLYAMLTGRPPFLGDDVLSVLHQQAHASPVPPRQLGADIAPPLEALVLRMLAKDPEARPRTVSEIAGRLADRGQAPAASAAPPPMTLAGGSRRPVRRMAVALALAGAVALVLALTAGGSGRPRAGSAAQHRPRTTRTATQVATTQSVTTQPTVPAPAAAQPHQPPAQPHQPPAKPLPPGHGGVPPGHADGGPPGHHDKPPKPPKGPKPKGGGGD